jgi:hypothetical protein
MSDQRCWRAILKIGGKQMTAEVSTDGRKDPIECFPLLCDEMAKVIAAQVLKQAFADTLRAGNQLWK